MGRLLGLALAIVLASLLAWWLMRGDTPTQSPGTVEQEAEDATSPPPRLEGDAPDGSEPVDHVGPDPLRGDLQRATEAVTLVVLREGTDSPIEDARLRTAAGEEARTDAEGRATLHVAGNVQNRVLDVPVNAATQPDAL